MAAPEICCHNRFIITREVSGCSGCVNQRQCQDGVRLNTCSFLRRCPPAQAQAVITLARPWVRSRSGSGCTSAAGRVTSPPFKMRIAGTGELIGYAQSSTAKEAGRITRARASGARNARCSRKAAGSTASSSSYFTSSIRIAYAAFSCCSLVRVLLVSKRRRDIAVRAAPFCRL